MSKKLKLVNWQSGTLKKQFCHFHSCFIGPGREILIRCFDFVSLFPFTESLLLIIFGEFSVSTNEERRESAVPCGRDQNKLRIL